MSRNGKYICLVQVEDKKYNAWVKNIDIKRSESDTHSEPVHDPNNPSQDGNKGKDEDAKSKESESSHCKLDIKEINHIIHDFEINCENSYYVYINEEEEFRWLVTNEGNTIGISFALEKFFINGSDVYSRIQSHIKPLFKEAEKTKEGKYKIYKESIIMGEDSVIVRLKTSIVCFRFDVESEVIYDFKKINHTPVYEYENINLEYITPTTDKDKILIIYSFKNGSNTIVWDIKANEE